MTPRQITEQVRSNLARAMQRARDNESNPLVREEMSKEIDRIMKRWWPKDYR